MPCWAAPKLASLHRVGQLQKACWRELPCICNIYGPWAVMCVGRDSLTARSRSQEMFLLLHWLSLFSWTIFPLSIPSKQKAFLPPPRLFFFPLQPHSDIFCGFLVPCNIGFVRGDSSSLSCHCCSREKGTSCWGSWKERVREEQSCSCWCGGVRHPDLSRCPRSLNIPCGMGTETLSVQRSLAGGVFSL